MKDAQMQVFKNMQHAIVVALHTLGASSPYGDGSVRTKELFNRVENAPIEANGEVDTGPHRFSIFNSALCGRVSAAELFERAEDQNRQGAWWKLKLPFESALSFSIEQKGAREKKTRVRQKTNAKNEVLKKYDIIIGSSKKKTEILEICEKIQQFSNLTSDLRLQNKKLEEQLEILSDEINVLERNASKETIEILNIFKKSQEQIEKLKILMKNTKKDLFEMNENAVKIQETL